MLLVLALGANAQRNSGQPALTPAAVEDGIAVFFSPKGGCTEAVVQAIDSAKRTLDVQAYSFTSTDIAAAIGRAHERGVKVRTVLDKSNETGKYSGATYLANKGVPVWIDSKHSIAHNKVIVIDGTNVITGSFNFTQAAEKSNAENLVIITGRPKVARAYAENFEGHLGHSEKYEGLGK
jgi:phosphatidylserine/phosphatidylglycerophosphate/cardiolipin synthase-like enzyme